MIPIKGNIFLTESENKNCISNLFLYDIIKISIYL